MSEVTPFEVKDYLEIARERYTEQFKNKEVFDRYIQLLIYGQQQLQEVYRDLIQGRSLDTSEGAQLDIIGELIGLPRGVLPVSAWDTSYFGFLDVPNSLPMADLDVASEAGIFFDLSDQTEGNITWNDTLYRQFLKAKIFANTSNGTPEELIAATKSILDVTYVELIENGNANLVIGFNRILSYVEKYILKGVGELQSLLPIPIGVGAEYIESDENYFGFEETVGSLGFASFEEVPVIDIGFGQAHGLAYGGGSSGRTRTELVGGGYFAQFIEEA